jgi:polyphosphate kinase
MKMNSLVDARFIRALYEASQAGVPVDLNVRGISCLRPGVPGVSDNINVVSVVGRFLEHSRIYVFERNGDTRVLIGSADLMPRNLDHRVELITPVEDPGLRDEAIDIVDRSLADNTNAWVLSENGRWKRRHPDGGEPRSVQTELHERYAVRAAEAAAGSSALDLDA